MSRDLSVTALYTSQVWAWGRLSYAHLFATVDAKRVFDVTNAVLGAARVLRRDLPPLRYSLLHRHALIDHLLRTSGARRVNELAAGLSRRGAAFSPTIAYTEIDLPHVIDHKRRLLERSAEGREVLARLRLVGGDALEVELPPCDLVIAEGLMMYLDGEARRRLFDRVRAIAPRFVFDLVPADEEPVPGAIGRALEAVMKRFTGGRSFERDAQTRDQIIAELHGAGFTEIDAIDRGERSRAHGSCRITISARRWSCSTRSRQPHARERRGAGVALIDLGDDHPLDEPAESEQRHLHLAAHDAPGSTGVVHELDRAGVADPLGPLVRDRSPAAASRVDVVVELFDEARARRPERLVRRTVRVADGLVADVADDPSGGAIESKELATHVKRVSDRLVEWLVEVQRLVVRAPDPFENVLDRELHVVTVNHITASTAGRGPQIEIICARIVHVSGIIQMSQ